MREGKEKKRCEKGKVFALGAVEGGEVGLRRMLEKKIKALG